ncbi:MAG: hypothetical protein JXK93_06195 [Sphaerochaetaceae bacterium]|nr:hypothetical protein [Sphaerochaetaceae bacterium]
MRKQKYYTPEQRIDHVKSCSHWRSKGKTFISYCHAHDVAISTMEYWMKKYGEQAYDSEHSFVKVHDDRPAPHVPYHSCSLTVNVGAVAIELPAGNSNEDLRRVLLTLKEII